MKISTNNYEYIRAKIAPLHAEALLEEYLSAGLSPKRYRWDLLYKAGLANWICDNLYKENGTYTGINDSHIDTVLRRITSTK